MHGGFCPKSFVAQTSFTLINRFFIEKFMNRKVTAIWKSFINHIGNKTPKIRLLGRLKVKCGSVIQVEGLRSSKAVAFINRKSNMRLDAKTYSVLRMSPHKKTAIFIKNFEFRAEARLDVPLIKKPGDEKRKKSSLLYQQVP